MNKHNYTLLDNVTHKDLRVIPQYRAAWGDNITSVPVYATELANVARHYPVLFYPGQQHQRFTMVALLGLEKNENLFLTESLPAAYENIRSQHGWATDYVPAMVARGPFAIGINDDASQVMMQVDTNSPRVSESEGKPLFLPKGGNSRYLTHMAGVLNVIHEGMQVTQDMIRAWDELNLLEPLTIDIELADGTPLTLGGHCSVSEEKVNALGADALHSLHQQGFLQGLFLVISSLSNIQTLIDLKNIRKQHDTRAYQ